MTNTTSFHEGRSMVVIECDNQREYHWWCVALEGIGRGIGLLLWHWEVVPPLAITKVFASWNVTCIYLKISVTIIVYTNKKRGFSTSLHDSPLNVMLLQCSWKCVGSRSSLLSVTLIAICSSAMKIKWIFVQLQPKLYDHSSLSKRKVR